MNLNLNLNLTLIELRSITFGIEVSVFDVPDVNDGNTALRIKQILINITIIRSKNFIYL
jgi:hypothetical protein